MNLPNMPDVLCIQLKATICVYLSVSLGEVKKKQQLKNIAAPETDILPKSAPSLRNGSEVEGLM